MLEVEVHFLLFLLFVVVALLEGFNQPKDGADFAAVGLLHRVLHVAFDGFELCELENEFGQIWVRVGYL